MADLRVFDDHPLKIYSNLLGWLQALTMRSSSAQQWIATIQSATSMRQDEIDSSGLIAFLEPLDAAHKVTKVQLLTIAEAGLAACQLTLRTERSTIYRPELQSAAFSSETIPQKILDSFTDAQIISCHNLVSFNYRLVRLKFTGMFGCGEIWVVIDERWQRFKPYQDYKNAVDAIDALYTVASNRFRAYSSKTPINYYERYSLLGKNSSYTEWLVCLPAWPAVFDNSHFDLKNLILHIRTSQWKDTKDQPLLLIDEMQSDWHALGRDHGYYGIGVIAEEGRRGGMPCQRRHLKKNGMS